MLLYKPCFFLFFFMNNFIISPGENKATIPNPAFFPIYSDLSNSSIPIGFRDASGTAPSPILFANAAKQNEAEKVTDPKNIGPKVFCDDVVRKYEIYDEARKISTDGICQSLCSPLVSFHATSRCPLFIITSQLWQSS